MNITETQLRSQISRIKAAGWLAYFNHAGSMYDFNPAILIAIGSRETNLQSIKGDGGHGHGVMQIDDRSFPVYCGGDAWRVVESNIHMGANILKSKMEEIHSLIGKAVRVGVRKAAIGKTLPDLGIALRCAVAAYNTGLNSYLDYSLGLDPDAHTTGHDYSSDVMARAAVIKSLI